MGSRHIMAVIKIPIEVGSQGETEYNTLLERATVVFEECVELPPIQDHDSIDFMNEISRILIKDQSGLEETDCKGLETEETETIIISECHKAKKPLNSSFKRYCDNRKRVRYTCKIYSA